jgi:hypothetical protein
MAPGLGDLASGVFECAGWVVALTMVGDGRWARQPAASSGALATI